MKGHWTFSKATGCDKKKTLCKDLQGKASLYD